VKMGREFGMEWMKQGQVKNSRPKLIRRERQRSEYVLVCYNVRRFRSLLEYFRLSSHRLMDTTLPTIRPP
jgi:hypothetical protein